MNIGKDLNRHSFLVQDMHFSQLRKYLLEHSFIIVKCPIIVKCKKSFTYFLEVTGKIPIVPWKHVS